MRRKVNAIVMLLMCVTVGVFSSKLLRESEADIPRSSHSDVFFDIADFQLSEATLKFPANMTFHDIAKEIVESYSPSSLAPQVKFTHRNIPDPENIGEEVTPAMLGLEGYENFEDQPAGQIKVTMGYVAFVKVEIDNIRFFILDLDENVGDWLKKALKNYNRSGVLYVDNIAVSAFDSLRNAFKGHINDIEKLIKGDITIKLSQECIVVNTNGIILRTSISQVETLENLLTRLDFIIPEADLLNKKMLCIDPACQELITKMAAPFSSYHIDDYRTLYIPGPLRVHVKVRSSGESLNFVLLRTTTVDEFVAEIRRSFFTNNPTIHLGIHSLHPGHQHEFVIDSLNTENNKVSLLANLGAYSFEVVTEGLQNCDIEVVWTYPYADSSFETFKQSYPCSSTLEEISVPIHKYFSKSYSHRLYANEEEMLMNPPGIIVPRYIPGESQGINTYSMPIDTFGEKEGGLIIFSYNYQFIIRVDHSHRAIPLHSETTFYTYPVSKISREVYTEFSRMGRDLWSMTAIPLTLPPFSQIPLSEYYASFEDLNDDRDLVSIYSSRFPAAYYQHFISGEDLSQSVEFTGDYRSKKSISVKLTPQLTQSEFRMQLRRALVLHEDNSGKNNTWKRGVEGLSIAGIWYSGKRLVWKDGDKWGDVCARNGEVASDTLLVEVRIRKTEDFRLE